MRTRFIALAAVASLIAFAAPGCAQSSMADGLTPGDYLRLSGGSMVPVDPKGSLRDWGRGQSLNLTWESWSLGSSSGVSSTAFGLGFDYGRLPFKESQFLGEFQTLDAVRATSASASDAQIFAGTTNIRFRIPSPFIMPSLELGFGILHYRPSDITYHTASAPATGVTKQQSRTGGSISIGGGLDKTIYGRAGLFGEALYTYAFTSLGGRGAATPGGFCSSGSCDALSNTALATIRGGLRVQFGR